MNQLSSFEIAFQSRPVSTFPFGAARASPLDDGSFLLFFFFIPYFGFGVYRNSTRIRLPLPKLTSAVVTFDIG